MCGNESEWREIVFLERLMGELISDPEPEDKGFLDILQATIINNIQVGETNILMLNKYYIGGCDKHYDVG